MRLITEEGGVWTDATTICLRPLDEWLPDCMPAGFFCFRDPGPDRLVSNWFLAGVAGNRLACLWRDAHEKFWSRGEFLHHSSYDGKNTGNLSNFQRILLRSIHWIFDRNTRYTDIWFNSIVQMLLRTYPYCVMHYIYARECRRNSEWRELDSRMPYRSAKPILQAYTSRGKQEGLDDIVLCSRKTEAPFLKLSWKMLPAGLLNLRDTQAF
jgi:hypothetical protein